MTEDINIPDTPPYVTLFTYYRDYHDTVVDTIYGKYKDHLDMETVEDIFSDAFISICEKVKSGGLDIDESRCSVKTHLFRACNWLAIKKVTRNKEDRMPVITQGEDAGVIDESQLMRLMGVVNLHESGDYAISACDAEECEHALTTAIAGMTQDCRKVIMEHYWDGFSYKVIAQSLGIQVGAIKMQAKRCKDNFVKRNKHLLELCRK